MKKQSQNIENRIEELNIQISDLEKRLSEMIWERKKYIEFSNKSNE